VIVVLLPLQIVPPVVVVVTVGEGVTVINCVAVEVQPFAAVPVTVYVVVVAGVTVTVVPDKLPGIQLYVTAPPAVMFVLLPVQIDALVGVTETVGEGLTVIVRVAVPVHAPVVPVTVYVVVVAGETVIVVPDKLPGIQVYVVAPFPVIVVLFPLQIVPPVVVVVTVGEGETVINCVAVDVQPVDVPVTVYVIVVTGETVTDVPDKLPGIHV
jgi:hypothetical protein